MAENKRAFVLYTDLIHTVKQLTNEKAGKLFKHILSYVNDENPVTEDLILKIAFEPIKQQLKRDLKKYEQKKIQWSNAGKASAEAKKQRTLTDVQCRSTDSTVIVKDTVKVIYNIFYDNQISENKDEQFIKEYETIIKFMFGKIGINGELKNLLKLRDQLTYKQFLNLYAKCQEKNVKLSDILLDGENWIKPNKYSILYKTILNSVNRNYK